MAGKQKCFYAVGLGHVRGVYLTWKECQSQVNGYRNAKFRKFSSMVEADAYVKQFSSPTSQAMTPAASDYRYNFPTQTMSQTQASTPSTAPQRNATATQQPPFAATTALHPLSSTQTAAELDQRFRVKKRLASLDEVLSAKTAKRTLDLDGSIESGRQNLKREPVERAPGPSNQPPIGNAPLTAEAANTQRIVKAELLSQIEEPQNEAPQPAAEIPREEPQAGPSMAVDQPEGNKLTELRKELKWLKDKYTSLEHGLKDVVQTLQVKTDELAILRSQITLFEKQISNKEGGTDVSLQDAVNRIQMQSQAPRRTQLIETARPSDQSSSSAPTEETENEHGYQFDTENYCIVYTDGCCRNNGKPNARAGLGVFFGDGFKYNMKEPLKGLRPTNINAEIMAAALACNVCKLIGLPKLNIHTDSEFVIKCMENWMPKWEKNGWLTASKKPVENKVPLLKLKSAMEGLQVKWTFVRGHSNIYGNEMADRLANEGAEQYVPD
ncbi:Hypothetical predicted protein [Cloeon dipterum]|uniref:ribonuclease H n=1 Tax=Cloeon dipterum TaxID=197152 RepID=A0A8S1CYZ4_9INSE|nr:Hypothetical predicted protein [Cloeon dipterum]